MIQISDPFSQLVTATSIESNTSFERDGRAKLDAQMKSGHRAQRHQDTKRKKGESEVLRINEEKK